MTHKVHVFDQVFAVFLAKVQDKVQQGYEIGDSIEEYPTFYPMGMFQVGMVYRGDNLEALLESLKPVLSEEDLLAELVALSDKNPKPVKVKGTNAK